MAQVTHVSVLNLLILDDPRGSLRRQGLLGSSQSFLLNHLEIDRIELLGIEASFLLDEVYFPENKQV